VCERVGCKNEFYGEGRMRRTYYQRASKPRNRQQAATTEEQQHQHQEQEQTIEIMPSEAAALEGEQAGTRTAEGNDEEAKGGAKATKVVVQGEPVFLCFCSKECWATFPRSFEQAMHNASH
jgi:uncharacterized membrane protein YkoI